MSGYINIDNKNKSMVIYMVSLLNTDNYGYTVACSIPVLQQVVGSLAVLKNLIGAVKDVASAVFSCESFTTINKRATDQQNAIQQDINVFKNIQALNKNTQQLIQTADIQSLRFGTAVDVEPSKQVLLKQQNDWNLKPLSRGELQIIYSCNDVNTPIGQYNILQQIVHYQIENEIERLNGSYGSLELGKCVPVCERLHNIAIGVISAIPVVGTIYNVVSLQYMN